ncbi:MAG: usg protein [Hyphomicrobiaceae bacterium]
MTDRDFVKKLKGYSLTTAEILYHMPDYPTLLQTYIWQDHDIHPHFPNLTKFLDFWVEKLDGPLHTVRVAHRKLIEPAELRLVDGEFRLN